MVPLAISGMAVNKIMGEPIPDILTWTVESA